MKQDQWYRLSFDLMTGADGQTVYTTVRRGGGGTNGYETLSAVGIPRTTAGRTWTRYTAIFKAIKTVNAGDPITKDNGARIDFEGIQLRHDPHPRPRRKHL